MDQQQVKTLDNPDLVKILFERKTKEQRITRVENLVNRKITQRTKFLLDKAFELADGIYMVDERDPDKVKYYKKAPNLDAIIYLIDRLLGKPVAKTENKNVEEKKGIAAVQNIIIQLAGGGINKNIENIPVDATYDDDEERRNTITASSDDIRSGEDALSE